MFTSIFIWSYSPLKYSPMVWSQIRDNLGQSIDKKNTFYQILQISPLLDIKKEFYEVKITKALYRGNPEITGVLKSL